MDFYKNRHQININKPTVEKHYGLVFVLVFVLIIVGIMFGWGVSNSGSALRHREKYTYVYVVLFTLIKAILNTEHIQREHVIEREIEA